LEDAARIDSPLFALQADPYPIGWRPGNLSSLEGTITTQGESPR